MGAEGGRIPLPPSLLPPSSFTPSSSFHLPSVPSSVIPLCCLPSLRTPLASPPSLPLLPHASLPCPFHPPSSIPPPCTLHSSFLHSPALVCFALFPHATRSVPPSSALHPPLLLSLIPEPSDLPSSILHPPTASPPRSIIPSSVLGPLLHHATPPARPSLRSSNPGVTGEGSMMKEGDDG